jgi:hypothetical protein
MFSRSVVSICISISKHEMYVERESQTYTHKPFRGFVVGGSLPGNTSAERTLERSK